MGSPGEKQLPKTEPIGGGWWRNVATCPDCGAIHIRYTHADDLLFIPNHRVCLLCKLDADPL